MQDEDNELPFKTPEFKKIWEEYLQYRKQRKLPVFVPIGLKRTFKKLVTDSGSDVNTAIEMIEKAIASNWQGLFNNNKNVTNKSASDRFLDRGKEGYASMFNRGRKENL